MRGAILDALENAAARPVTPVYQNISTVTSSVLSPPADIDPDSAQQQLRDQITLALESKGVLP